MILLDASLGENMSEAMTNTIVGMGTVFVALIVISFLISCFAIIPKIQKHFNERAEKKLLNKMENSKQEIDGIDDVVESFEDEYVEDDTELVAVITAAIMSYMGDEAPADGLRVRSIRKINNKWRKA